MEPVTMKFNQSGKLFELRDSGLSTVNLGPDETLFSFGDRVFIFTPDASSTPVPDPISADHIEGLCNMLEYCTNWFEENGMISSRIAVYTDSIRQSRERATWLRQGKT